MPGAVFRNMDVTAIQKPFHHKVRNGGRVSSRRPFLLALTGRFCYRVYSCPDDDAVTFKYHDYLLFLRANAGNILTSVLSRTT